MKVTFSMPRQEFKPIGIEETLGALSDLAWRKKTDPKFRELAIALTEREPNRHGKIRAVIHALNSRFVYARDPVKEQIGPVPFEAGAPIDVDDAAMFVMAVAACIGIPCRVVAARFKRSWTCGVSYETEEGAWVTVSPLLETWPGEPEERIVGPAPKGES